MRNLTFTLAYNYFPKQSTISPRNKGLIRWGGGGRDMRWRRRFVRQKAQSTAAHYIFYATYYFRNIMWPATVRTLIPGHSRQRRDGKRETLQLIQFTLVMSDQGEIRAYIKGCVIENIIITYAKMRSYFFLQKFTLLIPSQVFYAYCVLPQDGQVGRNMS
jgi:hypothetical protein